MHMAQLILLKFFVIIFLENEKDDNSNTFYSELGILKIKIYRLEYSRVVWSGASLLS